MRSSLLDQEFNLALIIHQFRAWCTIELLPEW